MDDNEDGANAKRKAPPPLLSRSDQPDPGLSLSLLLPGQQGVESSLLLPTIVSGEEGSEDFEEDDDDDDEDDEDYEYDAEDYEYFSSRGFGDLLEGEGSNSEFGMEEDEIDPDDLSYEQLIELGEIIGEAKRGLPAEHVSLCLKPFMYKSVDLRVGTDRCVVCQVEYCEGENLVVLACEHPYHSECIGQWLQVKKTCPICSTEVSAPDATS